MSACFNSDKSENVIYILSSVGRPMCQYTCNGQRCSVQNEIWCTIMPQNIIKCGEGSPDAWIYKQFVPK